MPNEVTTTPANAPIITPSGIVLLYADQFVPVKKTSAKKWLMVLSFFFAIGGLLAVVFSVRDIIKARAYKSWPTANGRITDLKINKTSTRKGPPSYSIAVKYKYKPEGHDSVSGWHLYFNSLADDGYSSDEVEKIQTDFQPGNVIPVHYDPANKERSFLKTGVSISHYLFVPIGYLLFVGLGFVFLKQLKLYRQK